MKVDIAALAVALTYLGFYFVRVLVNIFNASFCLM